jgi:hypothetical protein
MDRAMKSIRAMPTPPEDKILATVKAPAATDRAKGFRPKPNNSMATSPPAVDATGELHSALTSVGDQLMRYHDKPASLATVGHALKQVALKIAPSAPDIGPSPEPQGAPEIGKDTSGLFGTRRSEDYQ